MQCVVSDAAVNIRAVVDERNFIPESNETNNELDWFFYSAKTKSGG